MPRIAVVLMNLGGPGFARRRCDRSCSICSAIRRSSACPALLRLPLARLIAWRRARVAREIYRRLGGGVAVAGQYRGAGAGARGGVGTRALAVSSRCATGIRRAEAAREVEKLGARRDRLPAALSAILDDDDGLLARRLAGRRGAPRPRSADAYGLLLSLAIEALSTPSPG